MSTEPVEGSELDAAWRAFDEGELEHCLELLEGLPVTPETEALTALCCLDLGDYEAARAVLDGARQDGPLPFDLAFAAAELDLREWRLDEARSRFEALASETDDPVLWSRLAVIADCNSEHERADELFARAGALDPDGFPPPPRLTPDVFGDVVAAAALELPTEFQQALEEVQVVVDPMPTVALVDPTDVAETPPDILGLFVGASDLDGSDFEAGFALPPTIYLFQRNLERACPDADTLTAEIKVTLWHELAHKLGFDEDGVDELGLA